VTHIKALAEQVGCKLLLFEMDMGQILKKTEGIHLLRFGSHVFRFKMLLKLCVLFTFLNADAKGVVKLGLVEEEQLDVPMTFSSVREKGNQVQEHTEEFGWGSGSGRRFFLQGRIVTERAEPLNNALDVGFHICSTGILIADVVPLNEGDEVIEFHPA
jgi:hypothetical protein